MQAERGVSLYCQRSLDPRYAYRRAGEALPFAALIGRARVGDRVWSVELGFGTWVWELAWWEKWYIGLVDPPGFEVKSEHSR